MKIRLGTGFGALGILGSSGATVTAPAPTGELYTGVPTLIEAFDATASSVTFSVNGSPVVGTSVGNGYWQAEFTPTAEGTAVVSAGGSAVSLPVVRPAHPAGLLTDGDCEAVGVAAWAAYNSAVLTKESGSLSGFGSQVLRQAYGGVNFPYSDQAVLAPYTTYRVRGFARSADGVGIPRLDTNEVTGVWTGTTSTSAQYYDVIFRTGAAGSTLRIRNSVAGNNATEWDDISIVEWVRPLGLNTDTLRTAIRTESARFVLAGDSYNIATGGRPTYSFLVGAPLGRITAYAHGGGFLQLVSSLATAGTSGLINYNTPYLGGERVALATHRPFEAVLDGSYQLGAAGEMVEYAGYQSIGGVNGWLTDGTADSNFRLLYHQNAAGNSINSRSISLYDNTTKRSEANLTTDARGFVSRGESGSRGAPSVGVCNALYPDILLEESYTGHHAGERRLEIRDTALDGVGGAVNTGEYLSLYGGVLYEVSGGAWVSGTYIQTLGDGSYDTWDYSNNDTPGAGQVKRIRYQEILHYLDATTLDTAQPLHVVMHLANETLDSTTARTRTLQIERRFRDAAHRIGVPWGGLTMVHSLAQAPPTATAQEAVGLGYYDAALESGSTFLSIYNAMEGVVMDGGAAALALEAERDATVSAFDYAAGSGNGTSSAYDFTPKLGDYLDLGEVHPGDFHDANLYAHYMFEAMAWTQAVLSDGDCQASDTSAWTAGNSALLTKEQHATSTPGLRTDQVLRIARSAANFPFAEQLGILESGKTYRIRGWARSTSGSAYPRLLTGAVILWAGDPGSTTTGWQYFDFLRTATAATTNLRLQAMTSSSLQHCEFGPILVVESSEIP